MNGQTICQYGSVTLYRCTIHKVEQRPIFESSGTDLKCWKFTVTLTGYLIGKLPTRPSDWPIGPIQDITGGADYNDSAASAYLQTRWRMTPRQRFWLATGCSSSVTDGKTLLFADPMSKYVTGPGDLTNPRPESSLDPQSSQVGMSLLDCNDGPRCQQFDVVHIAADNVFRIQATFEIHRVQCTDDDKAPNNTSGILSHRWSVGDSLNHNLQTTRTYRGVLEIATAQFSPHWFRSVVAPPIQSGFRRDHMNFVATEDGKKLAYTIIDQEIAVSAPPPATKWNVSYTEHSLAQSGFSSAGSISVNLEGGPTVDKMQLIMLGIWIISAKLLGITPGTRPQPAQVKMTDMVITEYIGDTNAVLLSASCTRTMESTNDLMTPYMDGFAHDIQLSDLPTWVKQYDPTVSMGGYDAGTVTYQIPTGVDGSGRTIYGNAPVEEIPYQGPAALTGIFRSYLNNPCGSSFGINDPSASNELSVDYNTDPTPSSGSQPRVTASITTTIDNENDVTQPDVDYLSASMNTKIYTHFQCEAIYRTRQILGAMPIAGSVSGGIDTSNATAMVTFARPQTIYILRIHGERIGDWPEFPDPNRVGSASSGAPQYATLAGSIAQIGMTLLSSKLMGGTVTKTANGEDQYRATLQCIYALNRAPTPTEILKFGHNPWSTDNSGNGTVSTSTLTNSTWK